MKKLFGKIGAMVVLTLLVVGMVSTTALAAATSLTDDTSERILNIHKYSPTAGAGDNGDGTEDNGAANGRIPLENVEFELYKVPAGQPASTTPSAEELAAYKVPGNLVDTVKTDANGFATKNFGTGNANDGIYLIVEKENPAVAAPAAPFYLHMPLTNPNGDGWLYTVNVYPKNDVANGPDVDKDVVDNGNNNGSADIGDIVTWIIKGDVPADLYQLDTDGNPVYAKNYTFTDNLDTRLDYKGNVIVKLLDKAGNETVLDAANYTTAGTTAVADAPGGTLKLALTEAGMKHIQETLAADAGTGKPEIRVYFDSAINDTAVLGEDIYNNVILDYTNSSGNQYDPAEVPENEKPEVHTGGLSIDKNDAKTAAKLAGASFKIARDVKVGETAEDTLTIDGAQKSVVYVDFYNTDAIEGAPVTEVTTDAQGKAVINGIAYGEYYLIETKAPDGYNLLSAPIKVTVNETSHTVTIDVENSSKFELPVTGGNGTILFTMGGVLLIGGAIILLVVSRKKKSAAK